jgi:hypothetical protein
MTTEELADYIINADMEIQIIQGDRLAILDLLAFDGLPPVSDYQVWEAIELARQDPYIKSVAQKYMSHHDEH